ncbi:hypothetical protein [Lacinutrix himadriensis]|uniref:hypothetical protein n=1 Tax=Lacinutrix himadriensis TaxID=641549 RepID=UPI0006E1669D|nr:hypothetical protein [Lacinutrix himadriensis]
MEILNLKSVSILCFFIFLINCKDNNIKQEDSAFDLCKNPCAILNQGYDYNTIDGTAKYIIPYPSGTTLTEVSNKDNTITYEITGRGDFTKPKFEKFNKGSFAEIPGSELTIIVVFENFDCNENNITKRKKKTVIKGSPIALECKFLE